MYRAGLGPRGRLGRKGPAEQRVLRGYQGSQDRQGDRGRGARERQAFPVCLEAPECLEPRETQDPWDLLGPEEQRGCQGLGEQQGNQVPLEQRAAWARPPALDQASM